jgi:hypothetical protein
MPGVRWWAVAAVLIPGMVASACGIAHLWREPPAPVPAVVPVQKKAWEAAFGGRDAAKPHLAARLTSWPTRLLVDRAEFPADDVAFLHRLAADTWRGIEAMVDMETGLPLDHLRFPKNSLEPADADIGDYTSTTNIGLYLAALVGAHDLGLVSRDAAVARIRAVIATLNRLETYHGFFFNFYDTVSLERTSSLLSFVDSMWMQAGLVVARRTFSELLVETRELVAARSFRLFYDERYRLMTHGYDVHAHRSSPYHYGAFYTEARLGSLLAIGQRQAPREHWFEMQRTFKPRLVREYRGNEQIERPMPERMTKRYYEWRGIRYVPSWGGSMFEALMPALFVDEQRVAPWSLGRNGAAHVKGHRVYARRELRYPVWGMSPCMLPSGQYHEFGVPPFGVRGYDNGAVTPHASALALAVAPRAAVRNLRELVKHYDVYGDFGFYDAVVPETGEVSRAYLMLDQAMTFLALVNHLRDGAIQRAFQSDPAVARMLPVVAVERFFD